MGRPASSSPSPSCLHVGAVHPSAAAAGAGPAGAGRRARGRRRGHDHRRHLRHASPRSTTTTCTLEVAPGVVLRLARGAIARRSTGAAPAVDDEPTSTPTPSTSREPPADDHAEPRCADVADAPRDAPGLRLARRHRRGRRRLAGRHARRGQLAAARPRPPGRRVGRAPAQRATSSDEPLDQASRSSATGSTPSAWPSPRSPARATSIVVQLPGVKDRERALELVGQTAELRFRPVLPAVATRGARRRPATGRPPTHRRHAGDPTRRRPPPRRRDRPRRPCHRRRPTRQRRRRAALRRRSRPTTTTAATTTSTDPTTSTTDAGDHHDHRAGDPVTSAARRQPTPETEDRRLRGHPAAEGRYDRHGLLPCSGPAALGR